MPHVMHFIYLVDCGSNDNVLSPRVDNKVSKQVATIQSTNISCMCLLMIVIITSVIVVVIYSHGLDILMKGSCDNVSLQTGHYLNTLVGFLDDI
jgi:hypothetical protein